jgi:hypothetical protein
LSLSFLSETASGANEESDEVSHRRPVMMGRKGPMRASDALADTIGLSRKQSQAMRSFLSSAETRGPRPQIQRRQSDLDQGEQDVLDK